MAALKIAFLQFIGFGTLLWMRLVAPTPASPEWNLSRVAPPWPVARALCRCRPIPPAAQCTAPGILLAPRRPGAAETATSTAPRNSFSQSSGGPPSTPAQGRNGLAYAPPVD